MTGRHTTAHDVYAHALGHLVRRIRAAAAENEPFSHAYFTDLLPPDLYPELLDHLPDPAVYSAAAERHYGDATGNSVRWMYALHTKGLEQLPARGRELWR